MKEHLLSLIQPQTNPIQARNQAREYLQALILQSMQRAGALVPLAFHGGTALRFLYGSQRYSEDLDFALEGDPKEYDHRVCIQTIRRDLEAQGYKITLKVSDQKTVQHAFVRFPGLLFDLGLSPHVDEALAVKIEVDTRPPAGAKLETTLVRRHVLLNLQHHDRASLLAGKLHAVLQRPYLKGRDWYDLIWYLSAPDWPAPNLVLLNNALLQTGWSGPYLESDTWRAVVQDHLKDISWEQVVSDVEPFLISPDESQLLTLDNLERLLVKGPYPK
ncbi:MAG: nucleotidyl transferase AbiEii/AbiGii toxin family protein [Chloroflexi bacterium]|nr:nucleotidyl transferase AbiEii/AbiGii toxin family protein [Chloroflexota bacterium]